MCECEGKGSMCSACHWRVWCLFMDFWRTVTYNIHEHK